MFVSMEHISRCPRDGYGRAEAREHRIRARLDDASAKAAGTTSRFDRERYQGYE